MVNTNATVYDGNWVLQIQSLVYFHLFSAFNVAFDAVFQGFIFTPYYRH